MDNNYSTVPPKIVFDDTSVVYIIPGALVFSVFVVLCGLFKWNRPRFDQLLVKIKGPPAYAIISTGFEFLGTSEQRLSKMLEYAREYGPDPIHTWFPQFQGVFLMKPEDIQIVLNSSKALRKDPLIYNLFHHIFGDTLFTASVQKWRKLRRVATLPFNSNILEQHCLIFNEKSKILIRYLNKELKNTKQFNFMDYIGPNNLNIICQTAMGCNFDDQYNDLVQYMDAVPKIYKLDIMRIVKPWLYPDIIFSMYLKVTGQQEIFKTVNHLPTKILKLRRDEYNARRTVENKTVDIEDTDDEKKYGKIFLDKLLEINDPEVISDDDDLKDEIKSLLVAGSETTAVTISYCLLILAIHPDIQNKVYDEMYDVFGDGDQTITIEDTHKLVYLDQVLKETLRLYTLVPFIFRKLDDDVKLFSENCILKKGTSCLISPIATHQTPELYPDPLTFNPENFNAENIAKRHRYSWIPFSGGPRGCLGTRYSILSMKVQIATLLRNYSFHTDCKMGDIKLEFDIILRSVHGYPVTIRPRTRQPTFKTE